MNYRFIDMENSPRAGHFAYFKSLANPFAAVTCRVDVTEFVKTLRERKDPFFLTFQYCAANALNTVPELRRRITADGRAVEFDYCVPSHTLMHEDGSYSYCCTDSSAPFAQYLEQSRKAQEYAREHPTLDDGDEMTALNLIFVSSLHWLDYSSLSLPFPIPGDSNPRLSWGRAVEEGDRTLMAVTLMVHHSLADGLQIAAFFKALKDWLEDYASGKIQ